MGVAAKFYAQAVAEYNRVLVVFPNHGVVNAKKEDADEKQKTALGQREKLKQQRAVEQQIR
ncbi:MAG: hypothetical protein IJ849_01770 [Selenomonadaceae bacterium]|nr:hypothetical protein [Selenomonadaceae bacterium]